MTRRFFVLVLAVLVLWPPAGVRSPSAAPTVGDEGAGAGLAGRLLVATERMGDPRFARTVVFMALHDTDGALGLVVNRPIGELTFAKLFEGLRLEPAPAEGSGTLRAFYGGPVEPERGFVLHSRDVVLEGSLVAGELALTTEPAMLRALAARNGPEHSLFALGYAGWSGGQLESEIARGDWIVVPADATLVFADDPAMTWARAIARRAIEL
ncbi:MAG: YqgE/AlgH family protein [Dongiaceae bacterium]